MYQKFFIVILFMALFGLMLNYYYIKYLEKKHPKIWEELGEPSGLFINAIKTDMNVVKHLFKKEYCLTNDKTLHKFAFVFNVYIAVYILIFSVFMIYFALSLF